MNTEISSEREEFGQDDKPLSLMQNGVEGRVKRLRGLFGEEK